MKHLLPIVENGILRDGLLCPAPDSCKRCRLLRKKLPCGNQIGELRCCEFGDEYLRINKDLTVIGLKFISTHPELAGCISFDLNIEILAFILNSVKEDNEQYTRQIIELRNIIKGIAKAYDYSKDGSIRVSINPDQMGKIIEHIAKLNEITDDVSAVTSVLEEREFVLP